MKTIHSILIASLCISFATVRGAELIPDLTGAWLGTLDDGTMKLRVAFNISQADGGALTATMDSIDQGARGIPVDSVTLNGTTLRMEVNAVRGVYVGELDATHSTAAGQWSQGPQSLTLNLTKGPAGSAGAATAEELPPADRAANQEAARKLAGSWNGTLVTPGPTLRLRVNIARAETTGAANGHMLSLDQGVAELPLSVITLHEGKVRFEVRGVGGVYEGTLAEDGAKITGQWSQQGNTLPLELQKAKAE